MFLGTSHNSDIQVVLNPENIILRTTIPIFLSVPIDVDIGDDFTIDSLVIGDRHIWLRAETIISPLVPEFGVAVPTKKALYRYDLAALLSKLLALQGGIATRWLGMVNNDS